MSKHTRTRGAVVTVLIAAVASFVAGSALAANINGTAKNDTLRGTAQADRLLGLGGNDKLYGLAGNDTLNGGPGNDLVVGGPGADKLQCGPGRDTAMADARDKPGADCETIKGLPLPSLSVSDATSTEGNAGTKSVQFSVQLAKPSPLKATVTFATRDGSASAGTDYLASNGTLTFAPGEKTKTIFVAVMGDTVFEPDETFTIALSAPVNASLGKATATGTIKNEDAARPKAGRYSGTSSQNRPVSFDVDPAVTSVSTVTMIVDLSCQEVPVSFVGEQVELVASIPLGPDWRFSLTISQPDPEVSVSARFDGGLAVNGAASGTLRVDVAIHTPSGTVNCSTGDVSWTASPPA
jgi:Calx-beta domain/RTX calcium-binding nonapeptide repeat (4 copies)